MCSLPQESRTEYGLQKTGEVGILSEAERQTLYENNVDLGITDLNAEKLKVYTALVKPKDRLYISYNDTLPLRLCLSTA